MFPVVVGAGPWFGREIFPTKKPFCWGRALGITQHKHLFNWNRLYVEASAVSLEFAGGHLGIMLKNNEGIMVNSPLLPVAFGLNRLKRFNIVPRYPGQALNVVVQGTQIGYKKGGFSI